MDSKDLEESLRQVRLAEPPLGFDPDDVATRAARQLRTRRAMIASGGAVACVAAAAVAFLAGNPAPVSPADQPPPSTGYPSPGPHPLHSDLAAQRARDQDHLRDVLPGILPAAKEIDAGEFAQAYPGEDNGWDLATSEVSFRDDAGPASFTLTVTGPIAGVNLMPPLADRCTQPRTLTNGRPLRCEKLPQADGSTVVLQETGTGVGDAGDRLMGLDAVHYRTDGSTVSIVNDMVVSGVLAERYGGIVGLRARPPLTDQQLIALVTDPAFTLR